MRSLTRSLSTTFPRVCAIGGLGAVIAGAAWALPTADAPSIDAAAGTTLERVVAPEPDLPSVGPAEAVEADAAARPAPSSTAVPPNPAALADGSTTTIPDHLVHDEGELVAVTSTTTTTVPPATTAAVAPTTTAAQPTVAFAATQAYGSCGEAVPYDIFSGTATPGSTVTIASPYGSGSVTVASDGHWQQTVEFPTAPKNEPFDVTISGLGGATTLTFTATGSQHDG